MKKTTKRLTMIVAILLCLVLITSSVVSTTLAKFVITKSATTTVGFTNFGMTVKLDVKGLTQASSPAPQQKGDSLIATYNQLMLKPGDNLSDLFTITISGTATVKTLITVDVDIEYADEKFTIPANTFGTNTATIYMPAGFKVGGSYASAKISSATAYATPYASNAAAKTEEIVERALATKLGLTYDDTKMTKTLDPTTDTKTISASNVTLGIDWPMDYTTEVPNSNEIGTYLSLHTTPTISKLSIIITVEQTT